MNYASKTVFEFIQHIIKYDSIDDILNTCNLESEKGFIFERLFDIVIKFGFCDIFPNDKYMHFIGNSNNGKLKELKNYDKYLNCKVISGNSSGCSDISLKNKDDGTYIFISSKFPKFDDDIGKQKTVEYFDIQNIIAMIDENKLIYTNYKIFLVVSSKSKVLKIAKNAKKSSEYIAKYIIKENILDKKDLNSYFLKFKESITKHINNDWTEIYLKSKENLILRFHQEFISQKTSDLINNGYKSFLWGCKCRSGKTYIFGGIILKQFKIKQKLNVLIITPAPTETIPQFTDDLFIKFKDFNNFKIHLLENSKSIKKLHVVENNIFVVSKQLLQGYVNNKTINEIKKLKLDIIGFDENHFSGTTERSKQIFESYSSEDTVKIFLTATYNKPLKEWNIPTECQMYWDIEDESHCKKFYKTNNNKYLNKLKEKHGEEYINKTLEYYEDNGFLIDEIFKPYERMPNLHLITNMFEKEKYDMLMSVLDKGNKFGFCFDTLFGLNPLKTNFQYPNEIKIFLRYISGEFKEKDGEKTIFSRINNICSKMDSRIPFTQIWFLPSDNINNISNCLKKLMEENKVLNKYRIMCVNRQNNNLAKDVKEEIIKNEIEAKNNGNDGLILLAGNMLSLGITLNSCDLVILMNNTMSSDKVMQQMYRCMTEGDNKKIGFVVDLNISRVLNTCINYSIYKHNTTIEEKIKYIINNHLINIDMDMLLNKDAKSKIIIKKILDAWKNDPVNNFKMLLKKLDNDYEEFDNETQQIINNTFDKTTSSDNFNTKIALKDNVNEIQPIPNGKEIIRDDSEKTTKKIIKKEEINVSFTNDVLTYIIPLTCILTIKDKNTDFINMLDSIKHNNELLDTFNEQCLIWWNKKDLIDMIKNIVDKYFDKKTNVFNITIQFKMSLKSLIDDPKELLELINECLKPKQIEKKKYGEVFTPMNFINNNMLKDIEEYWMDKYGENIWMNENLTWYDATTGMGNFVIAIYYKLMEGLKCKIKNESKRKKHIIEKQLFIGEINKKNCFVVKQIFNLNNEFKLNLYEGDTLNINLDEAFGRNEFDIIIGNPPYNEELKREGAKPLYNKFIEYYVDKCKMLSFVTPSRWFSGGKGLDAFRKMMINRTDIVYIKHFNNACEIFGNKINIEGGVNHFLIDENYNGLCEYNGIKIKLNEFDIVVDSKFYNIVNKLLTFDKITKYYISQNHYNIQTNDKRLIDTNKKEYLKCYVSQQKGFIKYINKNEISKDINHYKVITARANGGNGCFGNIFVGYPNEVHTKSYISFNLNSEIEAKSLLSYMKCRLPNFMLSLRKISQDISESTCKWIPLPPLNKEWNDEDVYEYFKLTKNDVLLINETKINGYNKNIKK